MYSYSLRTWRSCKKDKQLFKFAAGIFLLMISASLGSIFVIMLILFLTHALNLHTEFCLIFDLVSTLHSLRSLVSTFASPAYLRLWFGHWSASIF